MPESCGPPGSAGGRFACGYGRRRGCSGDGAPHAFGFERHIDVVHAQGRQRIAHRVDHAGRGGDGAGFAHAFYTHGIHVRGGDGAVEDELRNVNRLGHGIIHQRTGDGLAIFVVDHLFIQSLAQALGDAALHLAIHQQGVDDVAAVVHGHVFLDLRFASFGVHLDRAHVRAEGEGEIGGLEEVSGFHARLETRRNAAGGVSGEDQFAPGHGLLVIALDTHAAVGNLNLVGLGAQQVRRKSGNLGFQFLNGIVDGGAADGGAAATKGADSVRHSQGIAVDNGDVLRADAELVSHQLGEGGFLALTVRGSAGEHGDFAGGFYAHSAALPAAGGGGGGGADGADFHVGGHANAVVLALLASGGLAGTQLVIGGKLQGALQALLVVGGVVGEVGGSGVGKFLGLGEILAAELGRVHVELAGGAIHEALNVISRLGTSGAAVGVSGHLVGEDAYNFAVEGGNLVAAGQHERGELRDEGREQLVVGAHVSQDSGAEAKDGAVLLQRQFQVVDGVATVDRHQQTFAASFGPLNGPAEPDGEPGDDAVFGVHVELAAKAAAHFGGDHAHRSFRQPDHERHLGLEQVGDLGGSPDGEAVLAGQVFSHDGAGLHSRGGYALIEQAHLHHAVSFLVGGFDVAAFHGMGESLIGAEVLVNKGAVL